MRFIVIENKYRKIYKYKFKHHLRCFIIFIQGTVFSQVLLSVQLGATTRSLGNAPFLTHQTMVLDSFVLKEADILGDIFVAAFFGGLADILPFFLHCLASS